MAININIIKNDGRHKHIGLMAFSYRRNIQYINIVRKYMYWREPKTIEINLYQLVASKIMIKPSNKANRVNLKIEYDNSKTDNKYEGISLHIYEEEAIIIKRNLEGIIRSFRELTDTSLSLSDFIEIKFLVKE